MNTKISSSRLALMFTALQIIANVIAETIDIEANRGCDGNSTIAGIQKNKGSLHPQPNDDLPKLDLEHLIEQRSLIRQNIVDDTDSIDLENHLNEYTLSSHRRRPRPASVERSLDDFHRRLHESSDHSNTLAHAPHDSHEWAPHIRGRRLNDERIYEPLRIVFDTIALDDAIDGMNFKSIKNLKDKILPDLKAIWAASLLVIPEMTPIKTENGHCGKDVYIPSSYAITGAKDADLLIFVSAEDCSKSGRVASASPCLLHPKTDRPIVGSMTFCLGSPILVPANGGDFLTPEQVARATEVSSHEIAHVLALISGLYAFYRDPTDPDLKPRTPRGVNGQPPKGSVECSDGKTKTDEYLVQNTVKKIPGKSGYDNYIVTTPSVRQVARNQFGCQKLEGARLENQPTTNSDCYGSHWDERHYYTEFMGAILSDEVNIFSALTLAMMEDSGWYKPNYNLASVSTFGIGGGCRFVQDDCIVNGLIPSYSKGFFCNVPLDYDSQGRLRGDPTCDPTHNFITQCDLVDQTMVNGGSSIPQAYQYFPNPNLGPWKLDEADFCPTASVRGVDCRKASQTNFPGEVYGQSSKCYNVRVPSLNVDNFAICLRTYCNPEENAIEIYVGDYRILCEYDGQVHQYPTGLNTNDVSDVIECPRFASICPHLVCPQNCAGRGVCNYGAPRPRCECFDPTDFTANCVETPYATSDMYVPPSGTNAEDLGGTSAGASTTIDRPDRPVEGVPTELSGPTIYDLMNGIESNDKEESRTDNDKSGSGGHRSVLHKTVASVVACLSVWFTITW